jgi:hypothetical protein
MKPNKYLDEIIEYGGEPMTRGAVIAEMQSRGTPQTLIDHWLQGQELAADLRPQHEALTNRY